MKKKLGKKEKLLNVTERHAQIVYTGFFICTKKVIKQNFGYLKKIRKLNFERKFNENLIRKFLYRLVLI